MEIFFCEYNFTSVKGKIKKESRIFSGSCTIVNGNFFIECEKYLLSKGKKLLNISAKSNEKIISVNLKKVLFSQGKPNFIK